MGYHVAADIIVGLHLVFVAFVVAGGFLAWRWRRLVWIHLPAAAWGVLIELFGWVCPLTPLEVHLRQLAGGEGYRGGFVEHYVIPLLYPAQLTRDTQYVLALLVLAANAVAYAGYVRRRRRT